MNVTRCADGEYLMRIHDGRARAIRIGRNHWELYLQRTENGQDWFAGNFCSLRQAKAVALEVLTKGQL